LLNLVLFSFLPCITDTEIILNRTDGKILVEDIVKLGSWTEDAKATEEREM
jgi:hypothetical protein